MTFKKNDIIKAVSKSILNPPILVPQSTKLMALQF